MLHSVHTKPSWPVDTTLARSLRKTFMEAGTAISIPRCLAAGLPAALACLTLASAARAQADDGSSLDVAILDILKARGIIDDAQYAELMEMARSRVDRERSEIDLIQGRLERL